MLTSCAVALVCSPRAGQVLERGGHPLLVRLLHDSILMRRILPDAVEPSMPFRRDLGAIEVPLSQSPSVESQRLRSYDSSPAHSLHCVHVHCALFQAEPRSMYCRCDPARPFSRPPHRCGCSSNANRFRGLHWIRFACTTHRRIWRWKPRKPFWRMDWTSRCHGLRGAIAARCE